jgi:translation initiation factor 2 subunit 2
MQDETETEIDSDLSQFDLSLKKKKKKKKVIDSVEEEKEEKKESSEFDDSEYDYTYLLDRIYSSLREKNPALFTRTKMVIPVPNMLAAGSRKTMWVNYAQTLQVIHRQPEHLQAYVNSELNTLTSIDSNVRLIIRGKFSSKNIQSILQKYIQEYVTCKNCHCSETCMSKDPITRLYYIDCDVCGASKSVPNIKNGYKHS